MAKQKKNRKIFLATSKIPLKQLKKVKGGCCQDPPPPPPPPPPPNGNSAGGSMFFFLDEDLPNLGG